MWKGAQSLSNMGGITLEHKCLERGSEVWATECVHEKVHHAVTVVENFDHINDPFVIHSFVQDVSSCKHEEQIENKEWHPAQHKQADDDRDGLGHPHLSNLIGISLHHAVGSVENESVWNKNDAERDHKRKYEQDNSVSS